VLLNKGLIQQVGTPTAVYAAPANIFVATFVGSPAMNLLPGRIESTRGRRLFRGAVELALDGIAPAALGEGPVTLGIRPEQVVLVRADEPEAIPANVELVERVGPDSFVLAHLADGTALNIRVDAATPIHESDHIFVRLALSQLRLFDASGAAVPGERS
jgi:ABC-type sugar transport system ATPase subunit